MFKFTVPFERVLKHVESHGGVLLSAYRDQRVFCRKGLRKLRINIKVRDKKVRPVDFHAIKQFFK